MGYRRQKKTYVLQFEDPDMQGLRVRAKGASIGTLIQIRELAGDGDRIDDLLSTFATRLLDWNLEEETEDGEWVAVPPTADGLRSQDLEFVRKILDAWTDAVMGEAEKRGPLDESLPDGTPALVASLPMDVSSASL